MRHHLEPLDARTHFDVGQIDMSFGTSGFGLTQLTVPYSTPSKEPSLVPYQMATDANGRTIVAAFSNTRVTFRRLDTQGFEDAAFTASPLGQTFNYGGSPSRVQNRFDFAVDATNRIYVLNDKAITRYTSSGKIDRSFGRNGRASVTTLDQIADLDVGADGHVWVAGAKDAGNAQGNRLAVLRLTADGAIDTAFADNGLYVAAAPAVDRYSVRGSAEGEAVRANADGSAVIAGTGGYYRTDPYGSSYLTRYSVAQSVKLTPQGRLDKNYGIRGVAQRYDLTGDVQSTYPAVLGIRGSGAVVVGVRYSTDNPNPPYGGFFRGGITATGEVDSHQYQTFATDIPGTFLPDGYGNDYFVSSEGVIKLAADSKVDPTFNGGKFLSIVTAASIANNGELTFAGTGRTAADGRFNVGRYYTSEGPSATLVPGALSSASRVFTFTVIYHDDESVNEADLNGLELRVRGPHGYDVRPAIEKTSPLNPTVTAVYRIRPADGRSFTAAQNGLYSVSLVNGRPRDVDGNAALTRKIGTLVINIA